MPKTSKRNIKLSSKELTITTAKNIYTISYNSKQKETVDYD